MSRQRVIGAILVWLVVVASVSALVWVVISRAGDDLVASEQTLMTTGTPPPVSDTTSPAPTPSGKPSRKPSSASPSPSAQVTPTPSASPSATPTEETSSPPSPSETPAAAGERRTWQGRPGSIVVTCGASGIRLVSAQPANGFRAEVHDEDGSLEVEFEGREDESGLHATVGARCVGGVPSFTVQIDEESGDD